MTRREYWVECLSQSADDCGAKLTQEQIEFMAEEIESAHENYDMAFYSPTPSDSIKRIESEKDMIIKKLQNQLEQYEKNAERAVKRALDMHPNENISIHEYGRVFLHGGRTSQIL